MACLVPPLRQAKGVEIFSVAARHLITEYTQQHTCLRLNDHQSLRHPHLQQPGLSQNMASLPERGVFPQVTCTDLIAAMLPPKNGRLRERHQDAAPGGD